MEDTTLTIGLPHGREQPGKDGWCGGIGAGVDQQGSGCIKKRAF